jgi:hypothetical protein
VEVCDRDRHVCTGVFHGDGPRASGGSGLIWQSLSGDDRTAYGHVDIEGLRFCHDGEPFDLECRPDLRTDEGGVDGPPLLPQPAAPPVPPVPPKPPAPVQPLWPA